MTAHKHFPCDNYDSRNFNEECYTVKNTQLTKVAEKPMVVFTTAPKEKGIVFDTVLNI